MSQPIINNQPLGAWHGKKSKAIILPKFQNMYDANSYRDNRNTEGASRANKREYREVDISAHKPRSTDILNSTSNKILIGEIKMRKEFTTIFLIILLVFIMVGCKSEDDYKSGESKIINTIETGTVHTVFVDAETGVMYLRTYGGGVCVMVNQDGTPKIFEPIEK